MPTAAELQAQIDQYQSYIDNSSWMNAGQRSTILPQYEATLASLQSQLDSLNTTNVTSPTNVTTPTSTTSTTSSGTTFTPFSEMSASTQASVSPEALTAELNDAQALYALRLQQLAEAPNSTTRQSRLADAEQALAVAQQNFNVGVMPSGGEAAGQAIMDPASLVTSATAPSFSADGVNNGLIAAGTGQAGAAPQAGVTSAGLAQVGGAAQAGLTTAGPAAQAGTTTAGYTSAGEAVTAQAPDYIPAATYQASEVSGAMDDLINMYGSNFATADPSARATVQGQLSELMQDFEQGTPPWAQGAMREAMAAMKQRGLGASSMAGQAIVQAAMEAALPIAVEDARVHAQFELQNLANEQQSLIFNTQLRANALLSDQAARNAAAQFNAASENQTNQFFAGLQESIARFNADQINSMRQFNAAQRNQVDMFNAGQANQVAMFNVAERNAQAQFNAAQANQVNMFNAGETNRINMFNVGEANQQMQFNAAQSNQAAQFNAQLQAQREQFNAQNSLIIAQANAQWRQTIALTEFQAQHESNMQAAQLATGLTAAGLDYLWQTERDLMSYAFTSAENAQDRRVSLITADMSREIARMELDAEDNAGMGSVIGSIAAGIFGGIF